jgi:hypothetical protein
MEMINIFVLIIGIIVTIIGIATFINPNFAKLINLPGSPQLKAIVAIIVGIVIIILGFIR